MGVGCCGAAKSKAKGDRGRGCLCDGGGERLWVLEEIVYCSFYFLLAYEHAYYRQTHAAVASCNASKGGRERERVFRST